MLFGFAFNTKHFGQQFCLGLSIISPKHIPFTIGDNKSPPPCPKAGGRGMNVPYLHFKTCCFTLWEESCLCWYLTIVLVPVFVTVAISTQGRYCSSNFHLNRVSEVKMLNDLSIKKNISWRAAINSSKVWLEWPWWGTWWSVDRN